ncbi:phage holin family protein [Geomonas sp. Red32]|uniref:phage holin family protein n=1 Tax=Geomonas sp. Red32 TaxID=2912856 RepID=UPI00202CD409|nr:phage holin family protein [Geomonas sp. Red32]MCM0080137.1 phage holin family protein [Geomonas sp. Red32]
MERTEKRHSIVRLVLELVEQSIVLVFLELKLGVMEIRRNVDSAKTGVAIVALGGALLLFSLVAGTATAIAALALVLPVWLSALIVTALYVFAGAALLFTGIGKLRHFTLLPKDTIERAETIGRKLKKHTEQRQIEAAEARGAAVREAARDAGKTEERKAVNKAWDGKERRKKPRGTIRDRKLAGVREREEKQRARQESKLKIYGGPRAGA